MGRLKVWLWGLVLIVMHDVAPLSMEGGEIEMVSEFTYLGLYLCDDGELINEVTGQAAYHHSYDQGDLL